MTLCEGLIMKCSKVQKKGFTLIELLVVIAIIALLLSIVMPGLSKAKQLAAAAVCMSNTSQLGKAYYLYADENKGYLTDAKPAENPTDGYMDFDVNGRSFTGRCFVAEPMDALGVFSNISLEDKIRGFEKGGLWAYLETPEAYNCPIDRRWKKPPAEPASISVQNSIGGYRSYSLGGVLSADAYTSPYTAATGEDKGAIIKYSQFTNPGAKITFLEEADPTGFNVNYWDMYLSDRKWWDPFAVRHNGSSTFAYADGHADRHKWTDAVVIEMSNDVEGNKTPRAADESSDDYEWFRRSYIPGRLKN